MLSRHQLGGDRERRRDGKSAGETGQETHDDQLLGVLHQRDQQGEEGRADDADLHDGLAAPVIGHC